MKFKRLIIIDGYIDEPTALGVPPYVSPYIRYVAGAGISAGLSEDNIHLLTIDDLRKSNFTIPNEVKKDALAVFIGGNPVPGKYLGGLPATPDEVVKTYQRNSEIPIVAGGPIQFTAMKYLDGRGIPVVNGDIEQFTYDILTGKIDYVPSKRIFRNSQKFNEFAVKGAFIVKRYENFPWTIAEIETGRGCPRLRHCSFCVEALYPVEFRDEEDVAEEISHLYENGIRAFRIGRQADILSYKADLSVRKGDFARPNPEAVRKLYELIRKSAPEIEVLHLDNVNPGTIATFPNESKEILQIIVENNTEGDVAAMGMETADPEVVKANNLKAMPSEVFKAIRIVNEVGGRRVNGIPKLLPGINLLHGLIAENRNTFKKNYNFLKRVLNSGLLLRRINIRQIVISSGTPIERKLQHSKNQKKLDSAFRKWREKIRKEIDRVMIEKVFPLGTVIKKARVEARRFEWSIARQLGTYPIAVEVPLPLEIGKVLDFVVVNHRERSVIGLPLKHSITELPPDALKRIKHINKSKIGIFASLPDSKKTSFVENLMIPDEIASKLKA